MTVTLDRSVNGGGISVIDDVLCEEEQRRVHQFLTAGGWCYGWRSRSDTGAFWHKHFAGEQQAVDCAQDLALTAPILHSFWLSLRRRIFQGYQLHRCYANGLPYGMEGATHTDSLVPGDYTAIYYPHEVWNCDWGGETLIFNEDRSDILAAIYPRPNRLLVFPGFVYHVARGVTRTCPVMRITLMFKARRDRSAHERPDG